MATVQNPFVLVLFLNRRRKGWSETYRLGEGDFDAAAITSARIIEARSWILAAGAEIVFAVIRQLQRPPPSLAILPAPIGSLKLEDDSEYWGFANMTDDCLWLWGETHDGRSAKRPVHAIADGEIAGDVWTRAPFEATPGPVAPPADPRLATPAELFNYYFATVRDLTFHGRLINTDAGGNTHWELTPWTFHVVREAGTEKVGRRWVGVSWEAQNYSFAPPFSPCGCIVMVVRSCYEAPCKFFPGGIENGIRWYVAAEDAAILPYPTIFWPMSEYLQYSRGPAVGEKTPVRKDWWSPGYSWGSAPGVAPTGTPAEFLGLGSLTYNENLPTPLDLVPECDVMMPTIRVDNSTGSVNVINCTHLTFDVVTFTVTEPDAQHVFVTGNPAPTPRMLANMFAVASNMQHR